MAYYDPYFAALTLHEPSHPSAAGWSNADKEPTFTPHLKRVLAFELTPLVRAPSADDSARTSPPRPTQSDPDARTRSPR
jgi:hypothetical protein